MREIDQIIVHCSNTPAGMDIGVTEIRKWHVEEAAMKRADLRARPRGFFRNPREARKLVRRPM